MHALWRVSASSGVATLLGCENILHYFGDW